MQILKFIARVFICCLAGIPTIFWPIWGWYKVLNHSSNSITGTAVILLSCVGAAVGIVEGVLLVLFICHIIKDMWRWSGFTDYFNRAWNWIWSPSPAETTAFDPAPPPPRHPVKKRDVKAKAVPSTKQGPDPNNEEEERRLRELVEQ